MTDFLYRLVDRSFSLAPIAAPLAGGLFVPSPDRPLTRDMVSEQSYIERSTNSAVHSDKPRGARTAIESPTGIDYQTDALSEVDRSLPGTRMHSALSSELPLKAPPQEAELESQPVTTSLPSHYDSLPQAYSRDVDRTDENESPAPRPPMPHVTLEPTHLASTLISTGVFPSGSAPLERDRSAVAGQNPTGEFENRRTTPLFRQMNPAGELRGLTEDVHIQQTRWADEDDEPRALLQLIDEPGTAGENNRLRNLNPRIQARLVDLDPASGASPLVHIVDPKRYPEALNPPHQDESNEGRERDKTIAGSEKKRERADSERSGYADQTSLVLKGGKGVSLKSTLAGALDDEIKRADDVAAPIVKPLRKSAQTLDSQRQQSLRETIQLPGPSIRRTGESSRGLDAAIAVLEAPQPIVVAPRIVNDSPGKVVYATDSRSMKHAADRMASRRENENDSASAPTIRVTIGRIEVRAIHAPPPPQAKGATKPAPRTSLDEYLRRPNGGSR